MKALFFLLIVSTYFTFNAQNAIKFDYDAGGSMIERYLKVLNVNGARKSQVQDSILSFNVYPNPTKEQITIEGVLNNDTQEASIFLYNINGALIKQDTYHGAKKSFSLSGLTTGIYFLEVNYSKDKSSNYKIFITE